MNRLFNIRLIVYTLSLIFALSTSTSFAQEDKRTPLEKYQGAYAGAYLICVLQQKKLFIIERAKQRGITLDQDFGKDVDIEECKKDGLSKMKAEYENVSPTIKNVEGRDALKEHYVHAIMHIKEITPWAKESEAAYTERMNQTFRESKKLYVRFEITQP
jgi:hypothetical protein